MSIASRINEIETHLLDDYSVLTLAGADLTGVNKNIVNLKMSWKERLLYFMNYGTDEVWNNWDKVNGTGTTLSLNNTEEAPMSLVYKGNTSQEGTPTPTSPIPVHVVSGDNSIEVVGKNLFGNLTKGQYDTNGNYVTSTSRWCTPKYKKGDNTQLSFYGNASGQAFALVQFNSSGTMIKRETGITAQTKTFETNTDTFAVFYYDSNDISSLKLQVSFGGTITTYEEYKSASYPISLGDKELCKIGTYQDKIDKSTGKNLFDKDSATLKNGYYKNDSGVENTASMSGYIASYIPVMPNTQYTISGTFANTSQATWGIYFYSKDKNWISRTTYDSPKNPPQSFTTPSNCYYIQFQYLISLIDKDTIMLNTGTTALPYEPYGTGWYLKKEIGKVVFNGTENWAKGTVFYLYNAFPIPALVSNDNSCKSKYFAYKVNTLTNYSIYIPARSNIWLRYEEKETANDLKEWISENNFEVYYALETPTYETITDTTLIGQLEALKKSYEEQTNISQVNNDLPFELSVTALEVMS